MGRVRPVADKDAVGTCPRMIRTACLRASGFRSTRCAKKRRPTPSALA